MFEKIKMTEQQWNKIKMNFPITNKNFDSVKCEHLFKRFGQDRTTLIFEDIIKGFKSMGDKFIPLLLSKDLIEQIYNIASKKEVIQG